MDFVSEPRCTLEKQDLIKKYLEEHFSSDLSLIKSAGNLTKCRRESLTMETSEAKEKASTSLYTSSV